MHFIDPNWVSIIGEKMVVRKIIKKSILAICTIVLMTNCGGGSATSSSSSSSSTDTGSTTIETGSTSVQALRISEQLSLVNAKDSTSTSLNASTSRFLTRFAVPTAGEYITDEAENYVFDESSEVMAFVNEILCYLKQTKYNAKVNEGPYIAMIETTQCNRSADRSDSGTNQSSGANANKSYEKWIVVSGRADSSAVQKVLFKIDTEENEEEAGHAKIYGNLTVTESPTTENPYGQFELHFLGLAASGETTMQGYIISSTTSDGLADLKVYTNDEYFSINGHVELNPAEDEGQGKITYSFDVGDSAGQTGDFGDEEHSALGSSHKPLANKVSYLGTNTAIEFTSHFAYDADFYLTTFDENSQEFSKCTSRTNFYSNVWEYKLYQQDGDGLELNTGGSYTIDLENGEKEYIWADYWGVWGPQSAIVEGEVVTDQNGNDFTIKVGDGKLTKMTRSVLTLADIQDDLFIYWDPQSFEQFKIKWNGSSLVKVQKETCSELGCSFNEIAETALTLNDYDFVGMWKEGFGSLDFTVPEGGLTNATEIPQYTWATVRPGELESDLTLYCYYECLKAPFDSNDPYLTDVAQGEQPHSYTFDVSEYALKYNGTSITQSSSSENDAFGWGVMSGAMVTTAVSNPWDVYDQSITYNWETGPNAWNKFIGLVDDNGDGVQFDSPVRCELDDENYGKFNLEYAGHGQLWGIPWEQLDSNTSDFSHWTQAFTLADGTELSCSNGDSDETYYVRALVTEQIPAEVSNSNCANLSVPSTFEASSADDFQSFDPADIDAFEATLSDDAKPEVMGGVLITDE